MKKYLIKLLICILVFSASATFAQTSQSEIYDGIAGFNYNEPVYKVPEKSINQQQKPKLNKTYVDVVFRILEPSKVKNIIVFVGGNKDEKNIASVKSSISVKDGDLVYTQEKEKRNLKTKACTFRFPITEEQKIDAKWATIFLEKKDGSISIKYYLPLTKN